ncbi:MAG: hypothetical protein U0105_25555 [Candidatus Obscuribacterales bacterium]
MSFGQDRTPSRIKHDSAESTSLGEELIATASDAAARATRTLFFTTAPGCITQKNPLRNNPTDVGQTKKEGREKGGDYISSATRASKDVVDTLNNLEDTGSSCPAKKLVQAVEASAAGIKGGFGDSKTGKKPQTSILIIPPLNLG